MARMLLPCTKGPPVFGIDVTRKRPGSCGMLDAAALFHAGLAGALAARTCTPLTHAVNPSACCTLRMTPLIAFRSAIVNGMRT